MRQAIKLSIGSFAVYSIVACASAATRESDGSMKAITNPSPMAFADSYKSGTRIKIRYYAGADGSKQYAGTFDSERDEACDMGAKASDGKYRCLPEYVTQSSIFADSNCSEHAFSNNTNLPKPNYLGIFRNGGFALYPVKLETTSGFYSRSGSQCIFVNTDGYTTYSFSNVEVPSTSFVETALQTEP